MLALSPQPPSRFVPADALHAVNDVTRRRLLESLRVEGPATLAELAEEFALQRLRLAQHVRVLRDAGLVRFRKTAGGTVVKFSPVGWARMRTAWERGLGRPLRGR